MFHYPTNFTSIELNMPMMIYATHPSKHNAHLLSLLNKYNDQMHSFPHDKAEFNNSLQFHLV